MKFGVILSISFLIASLSSAQELPSCKSVEYAESNMAERSFFLRSLKYHLVEDSQKSIASISAAKNMLVKCHSGECVEIYDGFIDVLREQMRLAKMVKAITQQGGLRRVNPRQVFTTSSILKQINSGSLKPTDVADFEMEGFYFSVEDQKMTLQLWESIYIKTVTHLPRKTYAQTSLDATNIFFNQLSSDLLALNPLLAFLTEVDLQDAQKVLSVFDQLVQFNKEFLLYVDGMQTRHNDSFWSYLNLTADDHEMGLVNFNNMANGVVEQYSRTDRDRQILCSAWTDLETQQRRRVLTSIGVGTAAAVVCGVGIWSGVGTIPAAAICSLTVADGLWGARRGYHDSQIAHLSRYAGIEAQDDGTFSEGVLSLSESKKQELQGDVVFLINLIGVIPVAKALKATHQGLRGSLFDLVKIPASDAAVSTVESQSAAIGYGLMILQDSELLHQQMNQELSALMVAYR